jgi:hypothetical protein
LINNPLLFQSSTLIFNQLIGPIIQANNIKILSYYVHLLIELVGGEERGRWIQMEGTLKVQALTLPHVPISPWHPKLAVEGSGSAIYVARVNCASGLQSNSCLLFLPPIPASFMICADLKPILAPLNCILYFVLSIATILTDSHILLYTISNPLFYITLDKTSSNLYLYNKTARNYILNTKL